MHRRYFDMITAIGGGGGGRTQEYPVLHTHVVMYAL